MKQTSVPNTDNNSKSQLSKKSDGSNSSKWQVKKLGEVCEVLDKLRKPITKRDRIEGEYPYYGATGILSYINNFIFSEKLVLIGEDGAKWESGDKTSFIAEGKYWVNNHAHVIKPNRELVLDEWIVCFLNFSDLRPFITGMTVPKLNQEKMRSIPIPLPPLAEQKRIVAILDQAFGEIEKVKVNTEQNLKNAKELFQSYLQGVFENKGDDWEEKKLGEVCEVIAGGDIPKGNFSKTITKNYIVPIYANGEKKDGLYGYTNIARINEPSITVSARGTIGYSVKRTDPFYPVVRLIVLTPKDKTILDLDFLLLSIKKINFTHSGTSIPQLTVPMVKDYNIPLPPLSEQKAIVQRLDALRAETQRLESIYRDKLLNLEELKKSILKKAFSGELRG